MHGAATFLVALALVPVTSDATVSRARYLMGTVCEAARPARPAASVAQGSPDTAVANDDLVDAELELAFAEAKRIENFLSTWIDDSELSRVNRGEVQPSGELRELLAIALDWSKKTNGAFDPRIKRLIDVWKTREEGALPSRAEIAAAKVHGAFEEGAFGKGYALDRMLAKLSWPEAMLDFGGQLLVRGTMTVTIADPAERQKPVLELELTNASLSTSSGSEKTFVVDGRRFSHILDPRTGEALPPRGSVSVIADDALTADILSTALYVMGEDYGLRWADAHGVSAIFINPSHHVRLSKPARERVRGLRLLDRHFTQQKD